MHWTGAGIPGVQAAGPRVSPFSELWLCWQSHVTEGTVWQELFQRGPCAWATRGGFPEESDVTRRAWPAWSAPGTERGAREGRQVREGHLRGGFRTGQTLGGRVQRAFQNPVFTRV